MSIKDNDVVAKLKRTDILNTIDELVDLEIDLRYEAYDLEPISDAVELLEEYKDLLDED